MNKDKPYRIMLKTVDKNDIDSWIMDDAEYSDPKTAYSDSVTKITDDKTIIIKLIFPED